MTSQEQLSSTSKDVTTPTTVVQETHKAARKRFSRIGRKQSDGSVKSSSSSGTHTSAGSASIRQPARSRIRRHQQRLTSVFGHSVLRGRAEMAGGKEDPTLTDDPSELSSHITAPGILKIFGNEICKGTNYKSVLATTHSSAKELVKEALERYSLSKADADAYVLCDVIGCIGEQEWTAECLRVVGDHEKPLLLQSLWKPREGYARRFEIHHKASVEEKNSRDRDTVTAGINAQARKLQKTRSRGKSMAFNGGLNNSVVDGVLQRSLSEADLSPKSQGQLGSNPECQKTLVRQSHMEDSEVETLKALPCSASESEEMKHGDKFTQYSIHPPLHFPYFLLLQGYSYKQDFIIYSLSGNRTVFGRNVDQCHQEQEPPGVDMALWAPDIQPQHCCLSRLQSCVTVLQPAHGAVVKRNGDVVIKEVKLHSGDVISLGDHYIFMYKDPSAMDPARRTESSPALTSSSLGLTSQNLPPPLKPPSLCKNCVLSVPENPRLLESPVNSRPRLRDEGRNELNLNYNLEDEAQVLKEIFARSHYCDETAKLAPSFLVCLCIQQSATCFPMADLRRLILQIANEVQRIVWEKAKGVAADQPDIEGGTDSTELKPVSLEKLFTGLQPLVLWMANSIELLHFIQQEVPHLLHGLSREEEEEEEDCLAVLELRLSTVRSAIEEAMTVLEEVIMFIFQQCVYYITKLLYPVLPGLLDSNPFSENGQVQIPDDVGHVLGIFTKTLNLVQDFHVHAEISLQLFTYLFFFTNAFLFNLFMEKGSGGRFYHWSCGVQIRANLDLLMDWACAAGLGELAQNYLLKLSTAVNLLATPRENLLQATWNSMRIEFAALSPAQLHHILREYNPRRVCTAAWTPSNNEVNAALQTADILESFDDHPPLILPVDGFLLDLKKPITQTSLIKELSQLQEIINKLYIVESSAPTAQPSRLDSAVPLEAKRTKMEALPKAHLEFGHTELVVPQDKVPGEVCVCEALLTEKLKSLELCNKEAKNNSTGSGSALDASCLLTPPNTPQSMDLAEPEIECQQLNSRHHPLQGNDDVKPEKGYIEGDREKPELGEDEVFVVELQRGPGGLGLSLVDGVEAPLKISGIYIKSVIPGTPAAKSQKLRPGDRILAVNGLRLVGISYHEGRELIQKSGDKPQLLVTRAGRSSKDLEAPQ